MALPEFLSRTVRTTAFRVAAASIGVFLLAAAAIFGVLVWHTNEILTEQVVASLKAEAAELASVARKGGVTRLTEAITARSRPEGPGLYFLGEDNGRKLAGNLNREPPELGSQPAGGVFRYEGLSGGGRRQLGVAIPVEAGPSLRLIIGRDIDDQRTYADRVKGVFLWGFGLLSLAGVAGGLFISRFVLKRIEGITGASRKIMAGDLSRRVPLEGSGDELDDLALNLNAMLDRIEQLMNGLREVSDNIAHDLKTPLNRLRNRAEAALRDPGGEGAYREGLEHTIEEADELIKTFNALLLIARLEAGAIDESVERVDLGLLVRDVAELYEPVAEEAGLSLVIEAGAGPVISANRQLVGQATANLIDNAIKYGVRGVTEAISPREGQIEVRVLPAENVAEISVSDRGPGISAADRERVLKRFVRLEESRTRPGTGLGLSLVAAVARLHGGTLRLEDNEPGLRIVLALPLGDGKERL